VKRAKSTRGVAASIRSLRTGERKAARPSAAFNLTPKERAILADPGWVTEDEADIIFTMRQQHEPTISLEKVAKELGLPLEN